MTSIIPSIEPTVGPTSYPTVEPTSDPTAIPTIDPTVIPTIDLTEIPSVEPTVNPTDLVNDDSTTGNSDSLESQWIPIGIGGFVVVSFSVLMLALRRRSRVKEELNRKVTANALSEHVEAVSESVPESPNSGIELVPGDFDLIIDENDEYSQIIEILKQCDAKQWEVFLENFKNEKVTDKCMEYLKCDPDDDGQEMWKQLIPPIGVRVMFKSLWNQRNEKEDDEVIISMMTMSEGLGDMYRAVTAPDGPRDITDTHTQARDVSGDV